MILCLLNSNKLIWFLIKFFLYFKNPGLSHKWELRFVGKVLNTSGTNENSAGKFGLSLRRMLLNGRKLNRCKLEMTNNKAQFNSVLSKQFWRLRSKHTLSFNDRISILIVPLLHSMGDISNWYVWRVKDRLYWRQK